MKLYSVLLLTCPILTGAIRPAPIVVLDHGLTITTSKIGPYVRNQNDDVEITIKGSQYRNYNLKLIITATTKEVENITLFTTQYVYYFKNQSKTFVFHNDNGYLKDSITYFFTLYRSDLTSPYLTKRVQIFAKTNKDIDVNKVNGISCPNLTSFRIIDNDFVYYQDYYNFSDLHETLSDSVYYTLKFEDLKFYYDRQYNLTYKKISFFFKDSEHLFPKFSTIKERLELPLTIIPSGSGNYHFKIDQPLFVNPKTLEMSPIKDSGFVATNKFFLPMSKAKIIKTYQFNIDMFGMGFSEFNYHFHFKYENNKNMIGDCSNSQYCIVSGISNG